MTSPAEYEAALCQLEEDPPDIRQHNANLREERWSHFSSGGCEISSRDGRCDSERRSFGYLPKRSHHSLSADIASRSSVYSSLAGRSKENSLKSTEGLMRLPSITRGQSQPQKRSGMHMRKVS